MILIPRFIPTRISCCLGKDSVATVQLRLIKPSLIEVHTRWTSARPTWANMNNLITAIASKTSCSWFNLRVGTPTRSPVTIITGWHDQILTSLMRGNGRSPPSNVNCCWRISRRIVSTNSRPRMFLNMWRITSTSRLWTIMNQGGCRLRRIPLRSPYKMRDRSPSTVAIRTNRIMGTRSPWRRKYHHHHISHSIGRGMSSSSRPKRSRGMFMSIFGRRCRWMKTIQGRSV